MKKMLLFSGFACLFTLVLLSCDSTKEASSHKYSHQPQFIDNVYIAGHDKAGTTENAVDHEHRRRERKAAAKLPVSQPIATDAAPANNITPPRPAVATTKVANAGALSKKYSAILGVTPAEISNYALYQFIDKWIGTNYRLGGCDISGIDCSGFAQKLYSDVYGVDLVRTAVDQFSSCKRIKHSRDAAEGDLVFFHIRGRRISHVGIYLANDYFVHASTSGGVMISNLNEDYWHKTFAGCGRVPRG
jgi:cell wall-associated NlpC family hydrolase